MCHRHIAKSRLSNPRKVLARLELVDGFEPPTC